MANGRDSFVDLERHRLRLEENVATLRKSLQYWQTWEAEYEGLKEEISGLGKKYTRHQLEAIGKDYGGSLLNEKEITSLLVDEKGCQRNGQQVIGLLSRRIDYVQENVKAILKRLEAAEERISALQVLRQPEVRNEEGLPLTEIREELDEDGNVISSSTTKPGDAAPQMVEALQKAGVKDLPAIYTTDRRELPATDESDQEAAEGVAGGTKESTQVMVSPGGLEAEVEQSNSSDHVKNKSPIHKTNEPRMLRKKSVTFAEDTKPSNSHVSIIRDTERRGTAMANDSVFSKSTTNIELVHENKESLSDEDVEDLSSSPVIPTNESPEDTALRRQMLQYSMNEVGAIVAEIDLDDSGSHTSFSEDEDGDDQYTSADEEEDDFGRSTRRVVDDDYRRDMQELANKLNARVMENIGPVDNASNTDGLKVVGNASDANLQGENEALPSTTPKKKGVRFAEELDISKAPMPQTPSSTQIIPPPSIRPVSEAIIERATPSLDSPNPTGSNKKPSRFKTARSGNAIKTPQEHLSSAALITKVANGPLYASRTQGSAPSLPLIPAANSKEKPFSGPINYVDEARSRQVPEGPPGITHSATVIERPSTDPNVDVLEPDELDPALLHQEVAMEYHRMRNRMIQRNGGFLRKDEEEEQEEQRQALGEDESGGRKVSRFKAARLAKLGK